MNDKKEFFRQLSELGLVIKGPIWPNLFQKSKFRRLVLGSGLGELFNQFIHAAVLSGNGAGAPVLRNLHVHNGSQTIIEDISVNRLENPVDEPPLVPQSGEELQEEEWAFNDSFDPQGHMPAVTNLQVELRPTEHPEQLYRGQVPRPGKNELIETVWMDVRPGLGNFTAEIILWTGMDDQNLQAEGPYMITLDLVP